MSASPRILRNFVNGEYVEPESDATSDVVSPVTAQVVATAPVSCGRGRGPRVCRCCRGLRGVG